MSGVIIVIYPLACHARTDYIGKPLKILLREQAGRCKAAAVISYSYKAGFAQTPTVPTIKALMSHSATF